MISVLLATDITLLTKHAKDMVQLPGYLTIVNLSHEIRRSRIRLRGMIVGLISIHKADSFEVKMEIYHQIMGIILKYKSKCYVLHKVI